METFNKLESNVRIYCRNFPVLFSKARDSYLYDKNNKQYIDFFAGAGTMNYGHNNLKLKKSILKYIKEDNIIHGLDMATIAKRDFLLKFYNLILKPRKLNYKIQFPGPTGTNAIESALKLVRKITGRHSIIYFSNAFHGMTLGALSVTANKFKRNGAGIPLTNSVVFPYDQFLGKKVNTIDYLEQFFKKTKNNMDFPAAVILETVQGEGGINVASFKWLKDLEKICRKYKIILILDDIQTGCGRTGTFFSFEQAKLKPDIVCLSKAIGAYGLPMSIILVKPTLDKWQPGEHCGTFRGNNLAFLAATKALELYWKNDLFTKTIHKKEKLILKYLNKIKKQYSKLQFEIRGRGLMYGLEAKKDKEIAKKVCNKSFQQGLIIETSGLDSQVIKIMPPLTIKRNTLIEGLNIIQKSISTVI
jgi:diaminobutyrate-2-oxoglutarate transaminase